MQRGRWGPQAQGNNGASPPWGSHSHVERLTLIHSSLTSPRGSEPLQQSLRKVEHSKFVEDMDRAIHSLEDKKRTLESSLKDVEAKIAKKDAARGDKEQKLEPLPTENL